MVGHRAYFINVLGLILKYCKVYLFQLPPNLRGFHFCQQNCIYIVLSIKSLLLLGLLVPCGNSRHLRCAQRLEEAPVGHNVDSFSADSLKGHLRAYFGKNVSLVGPFMKHITKVFLGQK